MKHLKGKSSILKSGIIALTIIVVCIGIWRIKSDFSISVRDKNLEQDRTAIEFLNLNDENNESIQLSLKTGWTAQKNTENESKSFTYKLKKINS